ncbi:PLP-dependent aminotransferase family protein [Paenibacillus naphthalenovorans]|uniref:MocR-like pyridoxine biosynthesis transcription factor PdxR n=1 Tax=Paenibacillus naphthalenovorans TaxID=162209 RepID=UPI00088DA157|nr:PLP-dependent aminotransferase family protein [Paenibacillus naphthalenovorans]SDJ85538.1 DNA-binding transcriptional regulator, MocR family, contains an aminotransferase domain [Paenibacillus naphthalenovorans]
MWKPDRTSKKPLYQQIAEYMERRINYGEYPPGSVLPSERKLASQLQVNRSTIVQAYEELRASGLIESRVGFGTRVSGDKWGFTPKHAANWRLYEESGAFLPNIPFIRRIREEIRKNPDIIDFASGELSADLFPNQAFQKLWQEKPYLDHWGYDDPQGYLPLRETLASFLQTYHGIGSTSSSILITSGSQQSLFLITQCLLSAGDAVAIEDPSYCYSLPMFQSAGLRLLRLPVKDDGIQPDDLLSLYRRHRVRMIFLNPNYQNPTGTVLNPEHRMKLLDAAADLGIPIVEDDPFSLTSFDGNAPKPLKAYDTAGNVLYIGSLSKIAASGLRIGWMVAPQSVVHRLADARQQMDFGLSVIPQWIAAQFLGSKTDFEDHVASLRKALLRKRDLLASAMDEYLKGEVDYSLPQGGLNMWCSIHKKVDDFRLLEEGIKRGVIFVPGSVYGSKPGYVRFSFSRPDPESIHKGIRAFAEGLKHC